MAARRGEGVVKQKIAELAFKHFDELGVERRDRLNERLPIETHPGRERQTVLSLDGSFVRISNAAIEVGDRIAGGTRCVVAFCGTTPTHGVYKRLATTLFAV